MRRVALSTDRELVGLSVVQVEVWFLWTRIFGGSATSTTSATTTATAERLFETLRVYCLVTLSTDWSGGLVVLRFCEGAEGLSTKK